jgi:membrane-associated phospholipid phosphatase
MNKAERIVFYSLFAVALVPLTIFDFDISSSLYDPASVFGKIFYVGGEMPFLVFGAFAVSLAYFFRPKSTKKMSLGFGALFLASAILMSIYAGSELTSSANRLIGKPWQGIVKILLFFPFSLPFFALGFFPAFFLRKRKFDEKRICLFAFMIIFYALYILVFTNLLKVIAYRPRFRLLNSLYEGEAIKEQWRPWYAWQTFFSKSKYASALTEAGVAYSLDDFLSFPSGHTIVAVGLVAVSYFPGLEKKALPIRIVCALFALTVGLSRIYLGDHNATDSLWGFYLGLTAIDFLFAFASPRFASFLNKNSVYPLNGQRQD